MNRTFLAAASLVASAASTAALAQTSPVENHVKCLTVETPRAQREAAAAAATRQFEGKAGAKEEFTAAVTTLVGDCARRHGWNAALVSLSQDYLSLLIQEVVLADGLRAAGIDSRALTAFGQALPDADRMPFFDLATPLTEPFRARIVTKLSAAGIKSDNPAVTRALTNYLHLTGGLGAAESRLAKALSGPTVTAAPAQDPRPCLFDQAPAAERTRRADVAARKQGWEWAEDAIDNDAVARCVTAKGWNAESSSAMKSVIFYDRHAQAAAKVVRPMGFNLDWVDSYLQSLDPREQKKIRSDPPSGPYFTKTQWPPIAGRFGRPVTSDAERTALWIYIGYRRELLDALRDFSEVAVTPPGTFLTTAWQLLPVIEANRPVFRPRELTKDERSELRTIAALYLGPGKAGSSTVAQLQRLQQLGETGDKAAMIAARDALAKGPPAELRDFYYKMRVDGSMLWKTTSILAAIWTAHIWQRHGYDDSGRKYMAPCIGGLAPTEGFKRNKVNAILRFDGTVAGTNGNGQIVDDAAEACGFTLTGKLKSAGGANGAPILDSTDNNGFNREFFITGARFNPVMGDAAFMEAKFQAHLRQRVAGLLFDDKGRDVVRTPSLEITGPWYWKYATDTGRAAQLLDADARYSAKIREERGQARARAEQTWAQAVATYNANRTFDRVEQLKGVASGLGLEYWGRFTALVPDWDRTTTNAVSGAYGSGSASGSQQVQVRTYDQNGNYTGSTTTSAVWADIMKMSSGPPR
ncbi:hypothetical protein [Novosphingobium sp. B 225]|uniref:hypothetical protein n=1 Tax=Novosphingobium sp. B 225 TaxID=1961849 RepID=UPI000B4AFAB1|nr:hypothetical protein [Novosphingobium sp. B 225]